jgi:hypothetical protein
MDKRTLSERAARRLKVLQGWEVTRRYGLSITPLGAIGAIDLTVMYIRVLFGPIAFSVSVFQTGTLPDRHRPHLCRVPGVWSVNKLVAFYVTPPQAGLASSAELDAAVREGIAAADVGRLSPFEPVAAWLASWGTKDELPPPE